MLLVVLVFGAHVVLTAGQAEISDGGTEGGGHPESGRSLFFRKSFKNKENVQPHPDEYVAFC